MHSVARFSKALPQGDRGGNGVTVPNPRARGDRGNNLHAYWDDLLGVDDAPRRRERAGRPARGRVPEGRVRRGARGRTSATGPRRGSGSPLKTVYNNLDPEIIKFADLPVGYDADAGKSPAAARPWPDIAWPTS